MRGGNDVVDEGSPALTATAGPSVAADAPTRRSCHTLGHACHAQTVPAVTMTVQADEGAYCQAFGSGGVWR